MSQIQLFSVASQQAQWLTTRQTAIANNIANANTPGFRPSDIEPFQQAVDKAGLSMRASDPGHMQPAAVAQRRPAQIDGRSWQVSPSGNAVSLEQELIKADEVNRAYAMNTNIVKAFHKMLMMSVK